MCCSQLKSASAGHGFHANADADLLCQLLANSVTKQELRTISVFNHKFSSFSIITCLDLFSTQWAWLYLLFTTNFVLFCTPGTPNNLLFLKAKPNSYSTKNYLCTSDEFGCEKIRRISTTFKFKFELCH